MICRNKKSPLRSLIYTNNKMFLVEMAGIEPASKRPSNREYHVRLLSVRTNTSFDFYRINKLLWPLKSNHT
jgi:hypothetical protein